MNAPARFAAALAVGMCFVASDAGAQTLKKIADTNKITVSYREAAIPFSYTLDSGKPVGFSVDLTQAIVARVRKELNRPSLDVAYLLVTGQNRIPLLVDGTYDLECGSTTNTAARSNEVAFTVSHFFAGTRLLVKKSSNIKDYADLTSKMVATTAGSTNDKVIRKYSDEKKLDMQFVSGADYAAAFQLVEDNKAVAFALDDILLFGLRANSANPASLDIVGSALQVEPYGCMVRKGDPEFKKLVDDTIAGLMKSGEFAKMYAKWFESPIPPKGVALNMPMSSQLKANLTALSDQPAL
jgi:glutamate/aspartate transport system substrate-binding protein